MQKSRQTQKAINPRNTWAYGIKAVQFIRAGLGFQWWRGSGTNTPQSGGRDGALKHNVLSTALRPKGDELQRSAKSLPNLA